MGEVHGIGPRSHVCDAERLGGNPGEPREQHVHDESPVEERATAAVGGVPGAGPQEVAGATDQQSGKGVAQDLERVAQRQRVGTSREQEQRYHPRDRREAQDREEDRPVSPRPQSALLAGREPLVREDLRDRVLDRTPKKPRPGRPERAFVPGAPRPIGANSCGNQRQGGEDGEHRYERRVRDHACVPERPSGGTECAGERYQRG